MLDAFRYREREARFAHAAGSDDGVQTPGRVEQARDERFDFVRAPDEGRQRCRKIRDGARGGGEGAIANGFVQCARFAFGFRVKLFRENFFARLVLCKCGGALSLRGKDVHERAMRGLAPRLQFEHSTRERAGAFPVAAM